MKDEIIEQLRQKITPILKEAGVVRSSFFGSIARGDDTIGSDVDILIEFKKENVPGLFGFVGLQQDLEDILHREVDLVTYTSLHPLLRDRILREQVSIYDERA